jgi:hypothetical protein
VTAIKAKLLERRSTISAAQTTPVLPLPLQRSSLSHDPLDQQDLLPKSRPTTPFQSSPMIPFSRTPVRPNTFNAEEYLQQKYDLQSQAHLLRSHYCRHEVFSLLLLRLHWNLSFYYRYNSYSPWRTSQTDSWLCLDQLVSVL